MEPNRRCACAAVFPGPGGAGEVGASGGGATFSSLLKASVSSPNRSLPAVEMPAAVSAASRSVGNGPLAVIAAAAAVAVCLLWMAIREKHAACGCRAGKWREYGADLGAVLWQA